MVQVDLPGAFAAGQVLALLSKKYLQTEKDRFTHRLMGPVNWYFSLMFAPAGLSLLVGWPAWEGMYWWEFVERPAFNPPVVLFYVGFYLGMILLGNFSYILAHDLLLKGQEGFVKVLAVLGIIAALAPFFLWPYTWYYIGTYAEYHATPSSMKTMFSTPSFFYPWALIMGYWGLSSFLFITWIKRYSEKISEPAQ